MKKIYNQSYSKALAFAYVKMWFIEMITVSTQCTTWYPHSHLRTINQHFFTVRGGEARQGLFIFNSSNIFLPYKKIFASAFLQQLLMLRHPLHFLLNSIWSWKGTVYSKPVATEQVRSKINQFNPKLFNHESIWDCLH